MTVANNTPSPLEQELEEVLRAIDHYENSMHGGHVPRKGYKPFRREKILALIARHGQTAYDDGYLDGFKRSGEGFNGEYPFGDHNASDAEIIAAILPPGAGEGEV